MNNQFVLKSILDLGDQDEISYESDFHSLAEVEARAKALRSQGAHVTIYQQMD